MKIKKIIIKSRKDFDESSLKFAQDLDKGRRGKPFKGEFFESLEAVRCFLTEKRLELWRTIRDKKPNSISALAGLVSRDFKDVHQDVTLLVEVGLVELRKPKGARTTGLKAGKSRRSTSTKSGIREYSKLIRIFLKVSLIKNFSLRGAKILH